MDYLTVGEIAKRLGLTRAAIYKRLHTKGISHKRLGRFIFVPLSQVHLFGVQEDERKQ